MVIKNVRAFCNDGFEEKDIFIENGRIAEKTSDWGEMIDGNGLLALPALVDIHLHGAAGHDFCEGNHEAIEAIAKFEASRGVMAFCPAVMSYDEQTLTRVMSAAAEYKSSSGSSDLVGINMEGPFISAEKAGAQNLRYLKSPDIEMFIRLQRAAGGLIKLVDIAPELPSAMDFVRALRGSVRISLAHSDCGYDCAKEFFEAGGRHITHLFNAMNGLHHRSPGPIAAAMESDCTAELIADGIHIHPAMVRAAFNCFGARRIILISDSMMACGMPNGEYSLGGQAVTVSGARCFLTEQPETLAGSCTDLYGCMKTAVEMGVLLKDAVLAATANSAEAIGIEKDYGSLKAGRWGNIILADEKLNIAGMIQKGRIIS